MRRWQKVLLGVGVALAVAFGAVVWLVLQVTSQAREKVVAYLEARLDSDVELAALEIGVWPRPWVVGRGLVVRQRGAGDAPPLVSIDELSATASFRGLLAEPRRISRVDLGGLRIHVPPRSRPEPAADGAPGAARASSRHPTLAPLPPVAAAGPGAPAAPAVAPDGAPVVIVDQIVADEARLEIGTRAPDRPPRVFALHRVLLHDFALEHATRFDVTVTNPTPPGLVVTSGTFGPVPAGEPGATPLAGTYTFDGADLGVFGGIAGTLTSRGEFSGPLDRIDVRGTADIPDFAVTAAGNPVHLASEFVTVVDGTSGNTELTDVRATWLESALQTTGSVTGEKGRPGRTVALDVRMEQASLEDVLTFAMKGPEMPMTGRLDLTSRFVLPPGDADVIRRMVLEGEFEIAEATFQSLDVQKAVAELSRRGSRDIDGESGESVVSDLRGEIRLRDGRAEFPRLSFSVPGAEVRLAGVYVIQREELDFTGELRLDATVSETQEGWRRTVARPFDRLLRGDGAGTVLPIRISGPRAKPKFGVDVKRIFR